MSVYVELHADRGVCVCDRCGQAFTAPPADEDDDSPAYVARCPFKHDDCYPQPYRRDRKPAEMWGGDPAVVVAGLAVNAGWRVGLKNGDTLCPACREEPAGIRRSHAAT